MWRTTPTIGELTQREPRTGDAPTERTEVRLLHDANALYIGVMSYDSEPDRIIGTEMTRDGAIRSEDRSSRCTGCRHRSPGWPKKPAPPQPPRRTG